MSTIMNEKWVKQVQREALSAVTEARLNAVMAMRCANIADAIFWEKELKRRLNWKRACEAWFDDKEKA